MSVDDAVSARTLLAAVAALLAGDIEGNLVVSDAFDQLLGKDVVDPVRDAALAALALEVAEQIPGPHDQTGGLESWLDDVVAADPTRDNRLLMIGMCRDAATRVRPVNNRAHLTVLRGGAGT